MAGFAVDQHRAGAANLFETAAVPNGAGGFNAGGGSGVGGDPLLEVAMGGSEVEVVHGVEAIVEGGSSKGRAEGEGVRRGGEQEKEKESCDGGGVDPGGGVGHES